jgi:mannosyltransferase
MPANSFFGRVKRHHVVLLLALVLLVSLFLRFYDLGAESIWLDEAESIKESALSLQGIADHTNQPPLYFLLLRGWIHFFGTSEAAIRSLSAVFGLLAVLFIFLAGKALLGPRAGLIGAFLASFAYYPVAYSQEARAYSLLLMLSALCGWAFIKILKTDKKWLYPTYLGCALLLAYTHFYGLFVILAQVLYLVIFFKKYKAQRWKFLASIAALVIALIPFVLLLKNRISSIAGNGFWLPRPDLLTLVDTLRDFCATGPARYVVLALVLLLAIAGMFNARRAETNNTAIPRKGRSRKLPDNPVPQRQQELPGINVLLLLWLFLPILIPFIESQFMTPVYRARYAIGAYPALCLLAANGLNKIKWPWVFYPVLILLVVLSSLGLHTYYQENIKEQWREVAGLIESKAKSEDVIVVCDGYFQSALDYYYRGNSRETGIAGLEDAQKFISSESDNLIKNKSQLWLILVSNKEQILNRFIKAYGEDSIKLARKYTGIAILQFDIAGPAK